VIYQKSTLILLNFFSKSISSKSSLEVGTWPIALGLMESGHMCSMPNVISFFVFKMLKITSYYCIKIIKKEYILISLKFVYSTHQEFYFSISIIITIFVDYSSLLIGMLY